MRVRQMDEFRRESRDKDFDQETFWKLALDEDGAIKDKYKDRGTLYSEESVLGKPIPKSNFRTSIYASEEDDVERFSKGTLTERMAAQFGVRGAMSIDTMLPIDMAAKTLLVMGKSPSDIVSGGIFQLLEQPSTRIFEIYWSPDPQLSHDGLDRPSASAMPQNPGKRMYDYCMSRGMEFVLSLRMGYVVRDKECFRVSLTRYGVTLVPEEAANVDRPVSIMNRQDRDTLRYSTWEFAQALRSGSVVLSGPGGDTSAAEAEWAPFEGNNFFMRDSIFSVFPGTPDIGGESPFTQWPKVAVPMLPMLAMSWFADAMARLAQMRDAEAGPFGTDVLLWHIARESLDLYYVCGIVKPGEKFMKWIHDMEIDRYWRTDDDTIPFRDFSLSPLNSMAWTDSIVNDICVNERHNVNILSKLFAIFVHRDDAAMLGNAFRAARSEYWSEESEKYFWPFVGLRPILHELHNETDIRSRAGLSMEEYKNSWMMAPSMFRKLMALPECREAELGIRRFYDMLPDMVPSIFRKHAIPMPREFSGRDVALRRPSVEDALDRQVLTGSRELNFY